MSSTNVKPQHNMQGPSYQQQNNVQQYNMQAPYQQQNNGQAPGPYQQQYNGQAPWPLYNMQGQGQVQGQYGVQQLYSAPMTDLSQQQAQNKQNFSSVIASVIGLGGPILLAAA
jgi:hypothetical protein